VAQAATAELDGGVSTSTNLPALDETVLATTRYLDALTVLDDESVRRPSVLPGWTRAHVITHLSRNAGGIAHALRGAQSGADAWLYASQESRDADVEAGAARSAEELREDAAASWGRLAEAAHQLHPSRFDAPVSRVPGDAPFPARNLVLMRRTEVEVHHADLDVGYSPAHWPPDFSAGLIKRRQDELAELPDGGPSMVLTSTDVEGLWKLGHGAGPEIRGTAGELAWWLVGRAGTNLTCSTGELPVLGRWR
jgi:maleylpyruvate isomerase